ncbi:MAG: superoxide dismutase, partial [Flavobacteriales bacterium]|nr:superoxide dismutase [Flavobacteriales bacterium]
MKRRKFIRTSGSLVAGTGLIGLSACGSGSSTSVETTDTAAGSGSVVTPFELPALPYAYDALEPNIDARTMTIHHDKHHAGYVKKLNKALETHPAAGAGLVELITNVTDNDADTGIRNNGGGHFNHSMYWEVMAPGGPEAPSGELGDAITAAFGSMEEFMT